MREITILGQGYVGLPLSLSFALHGCKVHGVDSNPQIAGQLAQGITHQTEKYQGIPISQVLQEQLANGNYAITTDGDQAVRVSDAIIITVGIPVNDGQPVFEYFDSACETVAKNLQKGQLVIVRSTVIPGTTEEYVLPLLEKTSGLKAGADFFLAYVPERIAEGRAFDEFESMPTVIGAINQLSAEKAQELLRINCRAEIITTNSLIAAETSKVLENLQRDVNIAMVQEFARFSEAAGIDIFEVIRLANTHKRVNLLTPGPGVGGYCIPNAFHYLNARAQDLALELPLLQMARDNNDKLPEFIVSKTDELLHKHAKTLQNSKIAVIGLAMKDYSPDDRLSPAVEICQKLQQRGAKVSAYDCNIAHSYNFKSDDLSDTVLHADALLILNRVDDQIDFQKLISQMTDAPVVIDTKNIIDPGQLSEKVIFWKI